MKLVHRLVNTAVAGIAGAATLFPAASFAHAGNDSGQHHASIAALAASLQAAAPVETSTLFGVAAWALAMAGCAWVAYWRTSKVRR